MKGWALPLGQDCSVGPSFSHLPKANPSLHPQPGTPLCFHLVLLILLWAGERFAIYVCEVTTEA